MKARAQTEFLVESLQQALCGLSFYWTTGMRPESFQPTMCECRVHGVAIWYARPACADCVSRTTVEVDGWRFHLIEDTLAIDNKPILQGVTEPPFPIPVNCVGKLQALARQSPSNLARAIVGVY